MFFSIVEQVEYSDEFEQSLNNYSHDNWNNSPFYSKNDTRFRFIRDTSLGVDRYNNIMGIMMENHDIDINEFSSDLWINRKHIQKLNSDGHIIGLHSHIILRSYQNFQ